MDFDSIDWTNLVVTGILGLVIAFSVLRSEYLSGRFIGKKEISYEILSRSDLIKKTDVQPFGDNLQILWKGKKVDSFLSVSMCIRSTGRAPILPSDFSVPLRINIDGELLDAQVTRVQPNELRELVEIKVSESNVTIEPMPLNYNNYLFFTLIMTELKKIEVVGHVSGTEIKEISIDRPTTWSRINGTTALIAAMLMFAYLIFGDLDDYPVAAIVIVAVLIIYMLPVTVELLVKRNQE